MNKLPSNIRERLKQPNAVGCMYSYSEVMELMRDLEQAELWLSYFNNQSSEYTLSRFVQLEDELAAEQEVYTETNKALNQDAAKFIAEKQAETLEDVLRKVEANWYSYDSLHDIKNELRRMATELRGGK